MSGFSSKAIYEPFTPKVEAASESRKILAKKQVCQRSQATVHRAIPSRPEEDQKPSSTIE